MCQALSHGNRSDNACSHSSKITQDPATLAATSWPEPASCLTCVIAGLYVLALDALLPLLSTAAGAAQRVGSRQSHSELICCSPLCIKARVLTGPSTVWLPLNSLVSSYFDLTTPGFLHLKYARQVPTPEPWYLLSTPKYLCGWLATSSSTFSCS